jgi:hypothetical protein
MSRVHIAYVDSFESRKPTKREKDTACTPLVFVHLSTLLTMASIAARFTARAALPAASALFLQPYASSRCEEVPFAESPNADERCEQRKAPKFADTRGYRAVAEGDFHNLFPRRQLWQPAVEYPLWDADWDGRQPTPLGDPEEERSRMRKIRKEGVTRHIILIRHGQYDETHKVRQQSLIRCAFRGE